LHRRIIGAEPRGNAPQGRHGTRGRAREPAVDAVGRPGAPDRRHVLGPFDGHGQVPVLAVPGRPQRRVFVCLFPGGFSTRQGARRVVNGVCRPPPPAGGWGRAPGAGPQPCAWRRRWTSRATVGAPRLALAWDGVQAVPSLPTPACHRVRLSAVDGLSRLCRVARRPVRSGKVGAWSYRPRSCAPCRGAGEQAGRPPGGAASTLCRVARRLARRGAAVSGPAASADAGPGLAVRPSGWVMGAAPRVAHRLSRPMGAAH
jgi:hypothetical protein